MPLHSSTVTYDDIELDGAKQLKSSTAWLAEFGLCSCVQDLKTGLHILLQICT